MKILQIQGLAAQGGAEIHTSILSTGLLERGHEIIIAAPNTKSKPIDDAEAAGCRVVHFKQVRSWIRLFDVRAGALVADLVRKEKIDLVHSHLWNADVLAIMAKFATGVPAVATMHGPYITSTTKRRAIHHLHRAIYRRLMRRMNRIIAISNFVKQISMEDLDMGPDQIDVVYNCSDVALYNRPRERGKIRNALGVAESDVVFGLIGEITERKGPLEFVQAGISILREGRPVKFMLVGDGPMRAECERLIGQAGFEDRFIFTGYRTDVPDLLAAMDVLAVTSVREGFGRTITEAMSTGLPVIAYDSGAPAEIIIDGTTGFLVPDLDVNGLSIRMHMLQEDSDLRTRLGKAGLKRAITEFDIPVFIARTERILLEAAGRSPSRTG